MQTHKVLSYYDGSRRNNFTAIRFLLAWMVIFAHSFALQPVPGMDMPLGFLLQGSTTTGQMAVDGFFAISGFLVAGSLVNRGLIDYVLSRALRLLPALIVCVFLTVFLLGPFVTNLPVTEYFSKSETYKYLKNALAFPFAVYTLPGVFEGNAAAGVNGSLWSIPYEVRCYMLLGAVGLLGFLGNRKHGNVLFTVTAFVLLLSYVDPELFNILQHVSSALLCFVIGVLFFCNRNKLVLDGRLALLTLLALYLSFGEPWFRYVYPLAWTYFLFWLAYRTPFLNIDERIGDCSYGIYIYAFPIQQLTAFLTPSGTPYTNMIISTAVVIPMALLSWKYIEKPALALKGRRLTSASVTVNS
jgi:peptidoglycan/LPS O-acetylase OafA/YrhL